MARPSAANEYVVGNLARVCEVRKLLTDVPPPSPPRTSRWVYERLRQAPVASVTVPARRAVLRRLDSALDREVEARLLPEGRSLFSSVQPITAVDLNGDVGAAILGGAEPDLMVLSGAPLLKPRIYSIPRLGTVNIHWGVAPDYRGQQSIFTALRRHDYAAIGVTLHHVDRGVDTGPVIAQGWPALEPADTLASIWAKSAVLASTMITEFVERLRFGPVPGLPRPGEGIAVRTRDRRVWHHGKYAVERRLLHRDPPHTEARITRCW